MSPPFPLHQQPFCFQKIRCASCGSTLQSCKSAPLCGSWHYLHCPNRHYAKDSCAGASISVNRLEQYVPRELDALAEQYLDKDELEQKLEFDSTMQKKKNSSQTWKKKSKQGMPAMPLWKSTRIRII